MFLLRQDGARYRGFFSLGGRASVVRVGHPITGRLVVRFPLLHCMASVSMSVWPCACVCSGVQLPTFWGVCRLLCQPVKGIQKRRSSGKVQSWLGNGVFSDMMMICIRAPFWTYRKHMSRSNVCIILGQTDSSGHIMMISSGTCLMMSLKSFHPRSLWQSAMWRS